MSENSRRLELTLYDGDKPIHCVIRVTNGEISDYIDYMVTELVTELKFLVIKGKENGC